MEKYIKLYKQFSDFIISTNSASLSTSEVKLINLILQDFENIASCGTGGGKRAKIINELIQTKSDSISASLNLQNSSGVKQDNQHLVRLISLEIEKFRGFTEKCAFSLEKQYNLVYGPNGSGKSSFCESLEYVLLGYINEAETKRIPVQEYIKNSYLSSYSIPVLKGVNNDGVLVDIHEDYNLYNFCFIEKCRIDSFARLSSFTAANQTQLLSTIFGLDGFNEFVKDFTDNIENYIRTENLKQKEFDEKALLVNTSKQNIINYREDLAKLEEDKRKVESGSDFQKSIVELDEYINGKHTEIGRLRAIEIELQGLTKQKVEFKDVRDHFNQIGYLRQLIDNFKERQQLFDQKIDEINLTDLYRSVLLFESKITDKCPVCETPMLKVGNGLIVAENPYENAKIKLNQLKDAAAIQENRNKSWEQLIMKKTEFIENLLSFIKTVKILSKEIGIVLPKEVIGAKSSDIIGQGIFLFKLGLFLDDLESKRDVIFQCEADLNKLNADIEHSNDTRRLLVTEKEKLDKLNLEIQKIKTQETTFRSLLSKAQSEMDSFNSSNADFLKAIENEQKIIDRNNVFIGAYKSFKQKLVSYKEMLPLQLVTELNDLIKEFYNFINQDDQKFELFHTVKLPIKSNEVIQVSFQDNPTKFVNALQVLSEGHIKCLGLSILLSKSINSESTFLIFDDIVNAIDDDHRGRIRDLILTNDHFKKKQLIITSHSEEFIKDFENSFTKEQYEHSVNKIALLNRISKKIQKAESTAHYLQVAQDYYAKNNKRDCLSNCRRALENVSERLWKKLTGFEKARFNIEVKLILRGPNRKPDLLNLISGIRACLKGIDNESLKEIQELLVWFEGLQTSSPRLWEFLNKGTHEESERDDFDATIVKQILDKSILLDTKVKDKWVTKTA